MENGEEEAEEGDWMCFSERGRDTNAYPTQPLPNTHNMQNINNYTAAISTSRYLSDFEEGQVLGRGGYGVVVAAVNR